MWGAAKKKKEKIILLKEFKLKEEEKQKCQPTVDLQDGFHICLVDGDHVLPRALGKDFNKLLDRTW